MSHYEDRCSDEELEAIEIVTARFRSGEITHDDLRDELVRQGLTDEEAEEYVNVECDIAD